MLALGQQLGRRHRSLKGVKRTAYDRAMATVAGDDDLRAALFRVVDVAPACATPLELAHHLAAYLDGVDNHNLPVVLGSRAADSAVASRATGRLVAMMTRQMAARFIVGETITEAVPRLRRMWEQGVAVTVDLHGDAGRGAGLRRPLRRSPPGPCRRRDRLALAPPARRRCRRPLGAGQSLGQGHGADALGQARGAGARPSGPPPPSRCTSSAKLGDRRQSP